MRRRFCQRFLPIFPPTFAGGGGKNGGLLSRTVQAAASVLAFSETQASLRLERDAARVGFFDISAHFRPEWQGIGTM